MSEQTIDSPGSKPAPKTTNPYFKGTTGYEGFVVSRDELKKNARPVPLSTADVHLGPASNTPDLSEFQPKTDTATDIHNTTKKAEAGFIALRKGSGGDIDEDNPQGLVSTSTFKGSYPAGKRG